MYEAKVIGLEEAQGAVQAMLQYVKDNPDKYWQRAAFAVMDERGSLVCFAKMDGRSLVAPTMALKKAYTSAIFRRSTMELLDYAKGTFVSEFGLPELVANCGHPNYEYGFTAVPGGIPILAPGEEKPIYRTAIGAIGVGGAGPSGEDHEVAMVGLNYINNALWPSK
jgi:uncharacterized protein GlcG (DUF336 family)